MKLGIIGGSGFSSFKMLDKVNEYVTQTPYGDAYLEEYSFQNHSILFLPRHGKNHYIPPHNINYRANIWACKEKQITHILATAAVGAINENLLPGMFCTCSSYIEFTKNRKHTFHDHFVSEKVHVDQSHPYSKTMNDQITRSLTSLSIPTLANLVMVVTEGPRYETSAEIQMFKQWGGDIVNMTGYPEVVLANEAQLQYSSVAIVTNYAAGISKTSLSMKEVETQMEKSEENLHSFFQYYLTNFIPS